MKKYKVFVKVSTIRRVWRWDDIIEVSKELTKEGVENLVVGAVYKTIQEVSNNPKPIFVKIDELEIIEIGKIWNRFQ